jgi:hypothetical protein
MPTVVALSEDTSVYLQRFVSRCGFATEDDAIRSALAYALQELSTSREKTPRPV